MKTLDFPRIKIGQIMSACHVRVGCGHLLDIVHNMEILIGFLVLPKFQYLCIPSEYDNKMFNLQDEYGTFIPTAAAGPPGSTAWTWQGLLPLTTNPQPTASPTICKHIHPSMLTI